MRGVVPGNPVGHPRQDFCSGFQIAVAQTLHPIHIRIVQVVRVQRNTLFGVRKSLCEIPCVFIELSKPHVCRWVGGIRCNGPLVCPAGAVGLARIGIGPPELRQIVRRFRYAALLAVERKGSAGSPYI